MSDNLIRCDRGNVLKMEKTPEGYLRGEAVVSRTGVFSYQNMDGTERLELRHPDDILTQDTIDSIKQIPVTMGHPSELVTSDSAKELQIGFIGDIVRIDGPDIIAGFTITDADAVQKIEAGTNGLSLGYKVSDLIREDGTYNGQKYTHRQTGTLVNHLAVVKSGRVGPSAKINLDGASVQIETENDVKTGDVMSDLKLTAVRLDGIDYQASPEVANALTKAVERADAADAEIEKVRADGTAKIDAMQATIDTAKADAEKLAAERGDEAINKRVEARVALIADAVTVNLDAKDLSGKTDREIMEAVIATRYDSLELDGKSDDYVAASFDRAMDAVRGDAAGEQIKKATVKRGDGKQEVRNDGMKAMIDAQNSHFNGGDK